MFLPRFYVSTFHFIINLQPKPKHKPKRTHTAIWKPYFQGATPHVFRGAPLMLISMNCLNAPYEAPYEAAYDAAYEAPW